MLWLKLGAPLLLLLGVVAQYVADYVWYDKRTKWHRRARATLLILQLGAGAGTIGVVVREHKASEENIVVLQGLSEQAKVNADASAKRDATNQAELFALRQQVHELNARLDPFIRIATQKYPGLSEGSALERLTRELADVRARTSFLERRVNSFSASVELVIQGEWIAGLSAGPERAISMPQDSPYVRFIHSSKDREKDIACYPTSIARRREGQDRLIVNVEASVRPGGWPLGHSIDELRGYQAADIAVAMVPRRITKSASVVLREARLKVFINGVPEVVRDDRPNALIELPSTGIRVLNMSGVDLLGEALHGTR